MADTIRAWLKYPGPAFLEVIIDREACVYPMVGPGLAYDSMITGDFIPSRNGAATDEEVDGSSMF
jgi:acetolactate synthase-1/2/3 large subunit